MYKNCIKTFLLSGTLSLSLAIFAQSPGGIKDQLVWLHGKAGADSANSKRLNYNPAFIYKEGSTVWNMPANTAQLKRATIFTVYHLQQAGGDKPVWKMAGSPGDIALSTTNIVNANANTTIPFSIDRSRAVINTYTMSALASPSTEDAGNNQTALQLNLGNAANRATAEQDFVTEFILYNRILKEKEIAQIETYLAVKYGITLQKDYINSEGEKLWSLETEKEFSNNIAGIGRDDGSSLYQKQGTGADNPGELIIGVNKIEKSNIENNSTISDGDYWIWGDNGGRWMIPQNAGTGTEEIPLSDKRWLIKVAGPDPGSVSTTLQTDISHTGLTNAQMKLFCLVIDRSGAGTFSQSNCDYIFPDNISPDGVASFSKLYWDKDGSGKDNFAFGLKTKVALNSQQTSSSKVLSFKVYPNPLTGGNYKMVVLLDKPAPINILIYDINQHLLQVINQSNRSFYQLSGHLPVAAGTYTVQLKTADQTITRPIIVQ